MLYSCQAPAICHMAYVPSDLINEYHVEENKYENKYEDLKINKKESDVLEKYNDKT